LKSISIEGLQKNLPRILRVGLYIILALGVVGLIQTKRFKVLKISSVKNCQDTAQKSTESYNSFSGAYKIDAVVCQAGIPNHVWKNLKGNEIIPNEVKSLCYYAQKAINSNQPTPSYRNQIGNYICFGSISDSLSFSLKFTRK
jgi:hypothetical protein